MIKQWIKEGAQIEGHWAWSAPSKAALPRIQNKRWARNAIDYFIKEQLDGQKMRPSAQANKLTLIRRVSLDVRGLPPSSQEVNQFLEDKKFSMVEIKGLEFNPFLNKWRKSNNLSVNYIIASSKS